MKKFCLITIIIIIMIFLVGVLFDMTSDIQKQEQEEELITKRTIEEVEQYGIVEWSYDDNLKTEENIFIYLTKYLRFSDAAACGIIANIDHETGGTFNPDIGNPNRCYGLIQWLGGRLTNLKNWCAENGKDYTTIQGQLDFMYWELTNADTYGTYEYIMNCEDSSSGAYDAGWYFCFWYERPANVGERSALRGSYAVKYYEMLVDKA